MSRQRQKIKEAERRFVLVTRATRMQALIKRHNTWPQAEFYLTHNGIDAQDYLAEHDRYQAEVAAVQTLLKTLGRVQQLDRTLLPNYQFDPEDVVVVVGQDGLVANTLKYLNGQPVIGVNPDPKRFDGVLLPFISRDLKSLLAQPGQLRTTGVTFAEATTNDGQVLRAVNDLFIGQQSHTSARYTLSLGEVSERHSSSGIIVSTGLGSTGWLQSVLAGARGVFRNKPHELDGGFAWDAQRLQFAVREPFPSNVTQVNLVFGAIKEGQQLRIESHMPARGVIFSDGMEADYIAFNSGTICTVGVSDVQGALVTGG